VLTAETAALIPTYNQILLSDKRISTHYGLCIKGEICYHSLPC